MIVGTVREIKARETRVGLTPAGVQSLVGAGHRVLVEQGAGAPSGYPDEAYARQGAEIVDEAVEVWRRSDLVVKVKEPQIEEFRLLRPDLVLFTYLHLAASRDLTEALLRSGVTAVAYETVELPDGSTPLLAPMSEVAGRMAPLVAAHVLGHPTGGNGKLLCGVAGVPPAHVVVVGTGTVGSNAARVAVGSRARVTIVGRNPQQLRAMDDLFQGQATTLFSTPYALESVLPTADVLVSGVYVSGARAPRLITREMVRSMPRGSVLVDVAIDQGGSAETSRPTTHADPVYQEEGVLHYCVTNMPAAYPATSTNALTNATLPYVLAIANRGLCQAVKADPALAKGVNCYRGHVTHPGVAAAWDLPHTPLERLLDC